jgi:hypothetical protein
VEEEWAGVVEANNKNIIFAKYVQNWTIMRLLIFHLIPSYPKISHCTQGHGNNLVLDLLTQLHFSCTSVTYVLLGGTWGRELQTCTQTFSSLESFVLF